MGLIKDLADEVDRTLHLIGMPGLLAFDDGSYAYNARSGGDIDQ